MEEKVLGYDCDGLELYEFDIVRTPWYSEIDFEVDFDVNPRQYTVIKGNDDIPVLVSIYDEENKAFINRFEGREEDALVPVDIKPISDATYYEKALDELGNNITFDYVENNGITLKFEIDEL